MEWAPVPPFAMLIIAFAGIIIWSLLVGLTAYAAAYGWKEGIK